ncbi:MAG: biotin/lipoyl-binding protein, partial [Chloroflexota bacterium]|nr:biotin/lipoyl-binding protein [Chloroflexota bacterium]
MKRMTLTSLLILAFVLAACGSEGEATATPDVLESYVPMISVTGEVLPAIKVTVSSQTGGRLTELPVSAGSQVAAGAVLARLDDRAARLGVQQAQAVLTTAEAQLAQVQAGARDVDVAQAEAAVEVAEAGLQLVWEGADDQQLIAAQAELSNAEAVLKQAQGAYDPIKWLPSISMRPESLQLEQATNAYDAAQARYQDLAEGPSAATIRQAQAQVAQAEASQELVQAGTTAEAIAVAEAQVGAAQVGLEQAELALAQTEIRATFAGVVGITFVEAGEFVAPGQPLC